MVVEKPVIFLSEDEIYNGTSSNYYEPNEFKGLEILEENWEIILDEFLDVFNNSDNIECSSPYPPNLTDVNAWKNIYFYNFKWKYHKNCKKFPRTFELLNKVPFLTLAEIVILEPNNEVLPHIGETNVTARGHLGLVIPGSLPDAGMEVNGEQRSWVEGKILLFNDAHRHRAWNYTSGKRMVLIFDVIKNEYRNRANWYCAQALSSLVIKGLDSQIPIIKRLPRFLQYSIHYTFSAVWYLYLPFQRRISWLP